jgi:hypothetical protein
VVHQNKKDRRTTESVELGDTSWRISFEHVSVASKLTAVAKLVKDVQFHVYAELSADRTLPAGAAIGLPFQPQRFLLSLG